jgi:hypothetical protein
MKVSDTCDAWLYFFAHIARENNKGKEIGGRVTCVTRDICGGAEMPSLVNTNSSPVGVTFTKLLRAPARRRARND